MGFLIDDMLYVVTTYTGYNSYFLFIKKKNDSSSIFKIIFFQKKKNRKIIDSIFVFFYS